MANKDLFEQAIADAKKLKEISMANAKQAIEEAFAPRIQEMFRMKLSEIDDATAEAEDDIEDTENMEEGIEDDYTDNTQYSPQSPVDEMTLEEILAELELEEGEEAEEPIQEAKKKEDDEDAEEADDESSDSGEIVDLSVDEFVDLIKSALADAMGGAKEEEAEPEAEETEPAEKEEGGEEKSAEGDVIPLDEILAQLEESGYTEEGTMSSLRGMGRKALDVLGGASERAQYIIGATAEDARSCTGFDMTEEEVIACVSRNYTARTGQEAVRNPEYVTVATSGGPLSTTGFTGAMEEGRLGQFLKTAAGKVGGALRKANTYIDSSIIGATPKAIEACRSEKSKGDDAYYACLKLKHKEFTGKDLESATFGGDYEKGDYGTNTQSIRQGKLAEKSAGNTGELNEAIQVINALKSQLNEVNLLNAKLLYVNKLFKAKNLTEAQKVKVISAFDRATTIRETKNIYAILSESLTTNAAPKKAQLKESLGFASKPIGSAPARPIVEADAYVYRMQQLAGLRQPNI